MRLFDKMNWYGNITGVFKDKLDVVGGRKYVILSNEIGLDEAHMEHKSLTWTSWVE